MLFRLGVRRGELPGIQVGDIDWSASPLAIERRPDEKHDPRRRQPRAKTLARRLPLDAARMAGVSHPLRVDSDSPYAEGVDVTCPPVKWRQARRDLDD